MDIILDTNFILELVKNKIDFSELEDYGKILVPEEALEELKKLAIQGEFQERELARLTLKILELNKKKIRIIVLGKKFVDAGILKFVEKEKNMAVATIDKDLKRKLKLKARILTLKEGKKIVLQ